MMSVISIQMIDDEKFGLERKRVFYAQNI